MDEKKNLLYFGCGFSGWYNFRNIIKIVATSYFKAKMHPIRFRLGREAYSVRRVPLLDLRRPASKGRRGGEGKEEGRGRIGPKRWKRQGRGGKGVREGEVEGRRSTQRGLTFSFV